MFISQREIPILREINKKVKFFFLLFIICFSLLIIRLFYIQVIKGKVFRTISQNNFVHIKEEKAPRGYILDRNGVILADNRIAYDVHLIPTIKVEDNKRRIENLNKRFNWNIASEDVAFSYLPIVIKKDISFDNFLKIKSSSGKFENIIVDKRPVRNYPHNELLFHTIGYVGLIDSNLLTKSQYSSYSQDDYIGQIGIEKLKEKELRGSNGVKVEVINAYGRSIPANEIKKIGLDKYIIQDLNKEMKTGRDISLTIDYNLQTEIEKLLTGKTGVIIVMETETGNILGMASSPTLDANQFIKGMSNEEWYSVLNSTPPLLLNRAINATYQTGSVFKVVPLIAALRDDLIDFKTKFLSCRGKIKLYTIEKYCWKEYGHGKLNWFDALIYSCNIFYYQLADKVGVNKIVSCAMDFNLGKKTGFDISTELEGIIPSPEWKKNNFKEPDQKKWYPPETMDLAIGQGYINITPIQLLMLYNTIALKGKIIKPRILMNEQEETEVIKTLDIDESIFEDLKSALFEVVNRRIPLYGTGYRASVKDFQVCGKTGTAQVVKIKEYRYSKYGDEHNIPYQYRDHAWFVGFAPKENTEITLVVLVEHGGFGGSIAAPIAREIFKYYFEHYYSKPKPQIIQIINH
jgi:penicillin-binding protein 2